MKMVSYHVESVRFIEYNKIDELRLGCRMLMD